MTGPIVIAGASGFVGRHLVDRLRQEGRDVVCGTRDPVRAAAIRPGFRWTKLDVDDPGTLDAALAGADALVFLVHRLRDPGHLSDTERASAERVRAAAERAGVRRIVYLGGPSPAGPTSDHLAARVGTGEVLRAGRVSTVELRAGMVIGAGSESWLIVRDLALRLPMMVLPAWLANRSQPVWIGDVVEALAAAIDDPNPGSAWYDLPGPEALSGEQILTRIAARVGMRPVMIRVPVLTPSLSSHWIRLVTRADITVARRLVEGLGADLVAPDDGYWSRIQGFERTPLDAAIDAALAAEASLSGLGASWERAARRLARRA
ncbi:MAG: hypothetical protein RLZZ383_1955 [Pseudomonadota bacterium]